MRKKQWRPGGYAEDQDFAELVALGAASAEALLAKIHGRAIDFAKCHYLFETAPQELPDGTHSRVGFLWQWKKKPADENTQPTEEYQISIANINHLLQHKRMVPLPPSFGCGSELTPRQVQLSVAMARRLRHYLVGSNQAEFVYRRGAQSVSKCHQSSRRRCASQHRRRNRNMEIGNPARAAVIHQSGAQA